MGHFPPWKRFAIAVACMLLLTMSLPATMLPRTAFAQQETISINPTQGPPGTTVTVTGADWQPGWTVPIGTDVSPTPLVTATADSSGTFSISITIPSSAPVGQLRIWAVIGNGGSADAWFMVTTNAPTVTMQNVWTTDSNNNTKTTFAPGDGIRYEAQVTNSGSSTVTATVNFLATGPQQIFSWSGPGSVAAGTEDFYSPSTVPANAPGGTYTLTVTVTYNGQSSTNAGQFTVIGNPTPSPTQPPTAIPTTPPTTIPTQPPTAIPTTLPTEVATQPSASNPTASQNIKLSESSGTAGLAPGVFGAGFPSNTQIAIQWFPPGSSNGQILTTAPPSVIADEHGNFSTVIQIPQNSPLGQGMVCAVDAQITACAHFTVEPVPPPLPPEINSGDVACEGLLLGGALLGLLELAVGVGEVGCASLGSLLEFWQ